MKISILSIAASGSDELSLTVELCEEDKSCKEKFLISTDAYAKMQLSKGECTRETYEAIETEAKTHAAYKRGLYILGFGACSKRALRSKLISKGIEREYAELALQRIVEYGFLNEEASAAREAEKCADKLWGEARIRSALIEKGYDRDLVDSALFALEDSGIDYGESCKQLIKQRYGTPPTDRALMQRLIASMMRYGYSISQIKSACLDILGEK